jgi:hypothetical protein
MNAYERFTFCDIQSDLYDQLSYCWSCISTEGFHIYVHRSLEDTINMNMNKSNKRKKNLIEPDVYFSYVANKCKCFRL